MIPLVVLTAEAWAGLSWAEVCNGVDDDGDGGVDEGPVLAGPDVDGDGYGSDQDGAALYVDCDAVPSAHAAATDCDESDPDIHPGVPEGCDAVDEDCDGLMDEGGVCAGEVGTEDTSAWMVVLAPTLSWELASDACDLAGWHLASLSDSQQQEGAHRYTSVDAWIGFTDAASEGTWVWSDGSSGSYTHWETGSPGDPYGEEDCAILEDDGDWSDTRCWTALPYVCERACVERWWFWDADGDGLGDPGLEDDECERPVDRVANALDCDDDDPDSPAVWYWDDDLDGVGGVAFVDCEPVGAVRVGGDCDDGDDRVWPGAQEVAGDGVDQDCDGADLPLPGGTTTDPGTVTDPGPLDSDGDGLPDEAEDLGDADGDGLAGWQDPDSDNDGVVDGVDPAVLDPGGVTGAAPTPELGCGCRSGGGGGWIAVWLGIAGAFYRRGAETQRGGAEHPVEEDVSGRAPGRLGEGGRDEEVTATFFTTEARRHGGTKKPRGCRRATRAWGGRHRSCR